MLEVWNLLFKNRSNVIPDDGNASAFIQVRSDALISEIDQRNWGRTIGYGEVGLAEPRANLDLLGQAISQMNVM